MKAPEVNLTAGGVLAVVALAAVALVWVQRKRIGAAVADAVNPASEKNLAYTAVNAVGGAVANDDSWTLGGAIYEATHDPVEQGDPTKGDKGVIDTATDRYWAWVRGFWGVGADENKGGGASGGW